jgi:hypothetical protein
MGINMENGWKYFAPSDELVRLYTEHILENVPWIEGGVISEEDKRTVQEEASDFLSTRTTRSVATIIFRAHYGKYGPAEEGFLFMDREKRFCDPMRERLIEHSYHNEETLKKLEDEFYEWATQNPDGTPKDLDSKGAAIEIARYELRDGDLYVRFLRPPEKPGKKERTVTVIDVPLPE